MLKIINPNNMTKNEAESLINFVSRVSLGEDVDLGQFFKPINDYQKGWNDAMEASKSQIDVALRGNNLDVDGESGVVYFKKKEDT